jgi:hypothetical protein
MSSSNNSEALRALGGVKLAPEIRTPAFLILPACSSSIERKTKP